MSSQTKSQICQAAKEPMPNCAQEPPPAVQCTSNQISSCSDATTVCGELSIKPGTIICNGTGNIADGFGRGCCGSQSKTPWLYSSTGALCSNIVGDCPIIGTATCTASVKTNCMCAGSAPSGQQNISNGQVSGAATIPATCLYPTSLFDDNPKNIQKFVDKFGFGDPTTKILSNFCGNEAKDSSKCPNDLITGDRMKACSNFTVLDPDPITDPTGGKICRQWALNAREDLKFQTQVTQAMDEYCQGPRNGDWIDDCRCINQGRDPTFNALKIGVEEAVQCWYIPCRPAQKDIILQPPTQFNKNTAPSQSFCPQEICQIVTANFEKSNLTEKNVQQEVSCSETKKSATEGKGGTADVRAFYDRNKGWVIAFSIGGIVLVLLIIFIVILTHGHHKKKEPPSFQTELQQLEK